MASHLVSDKVHRKEDGFHDMEDPQTEALDAGKHGVVPAGDEDVDSEHDAKPGVVEPEPLWKALPVTLVMGLVFGFALQRGGVSDPAAIIDQFLLSRFMMVKMFLTAVLVSMLSLYILSRTESQGPKILFCRNVGQVIALAPTIVGAFLLGAGMAISGSCPGTVFAQLGSGVSSSGFVLLGCLTGALVFGFLQPHMKGFLSIGKPENWAPESGGVLDGLVKLPYGLVVGGLVAMLAVCIVVAELVTPWTDETRSYPTKGESNNFMEESSWPPMIAGAMIGLLQFPGIIFNSDIIGAARSYQIVWARVLVPVLKSSDDEKNEWLSGFTPFMANKWRIHWQVLYGVFMILGAFISATLSGTVGDVPGVGEWRAFGGGFLILFGSRIANGCTSGHGISGFSLMWIASFTAIGAMFGGGIITALSLKNTGIIAYQ